MNFEEAFRAHVAPDLRKMAGDHAAAIFHDLENFGDVSAMMDRIAWDRGLSRMPEHQYWRWQDWISATLLSAVSAVQAENAPAQLRIDRTLFDAERALCLLSHRQLVSDYLTGLLG